MVFTVSVGEQYVCVSSVPVGVCVCELWQRLHLLLARRTQRVAGVTARAK